MALRRLSLSPSAGISSVRSRCSSVAPSINGPDVHVYLVATTDATDNATVMQAGFMPLGALKGTIGDQNYEVPADIDLTKYQAVTIWCRRFGVNFGTAPLTPRHS
jgi:Electron transfer DM13